MATNNNSPFRIFRRGEIWHAYISFTHQKRRFVFRESTGTADREIAQQYCIDKINAIMQSPDLTNEITLDEAAARWTTEVLQYQKSVQSRLVALNLLLQEMDPTVLLSQITKADISSFIDGCRTRNRKPATINRYLALLSAICTRAHNYWDCRTPEFKILQFKQKEPVENIKFLKVALPSPEIRTLQTAVCRFCASVELDKQNVCILCAQQVRFLCRDNPAFHNYVAKQKGQKND